MWESVGIFSVIALWTALIFLVLPCVHVILKLGNKFLRLPNLAEKAVLVTGCDSGFGRLLALKLANTGFTVFAGCLTENGQKDLEKDENKCPGSLFCFPLDVTSDESVCKAAEFVGAKLEGKGLWGLVNNAGIIGPTMEDSFLKISHYDQVMKVNAYGTIRMCHAFKNLVKTGRGRVVNMSSCAGRVPGPGMGPYFMSKHAVESYSDTLRHELLGFGVTVHLLEPQAFKTQLAIPVALTAKMDEIWAQAPDETRAEYGKRFHEKSKKLAVKFFDELAGTDFDWVVETYMHALTCRFPLKRYFIGWEALLFWQPLSVMPTTLQDWVLRKVLEQFDAPVARVLLEQKK